MRLARSVSSGGADEDAELVVDRAAFDKPGGLLRDVDGDYKDAATIGAWVATGSEKAAMLQRLLDGDLSIPAARVSRDQALVVADRAASGQLNAGDEGG